MEISELREELEMIRSKEPSLYGFLTIIPENKSGADLAISNHIKVPLKELKIHKFIDENNHLNEKGQQIIDLIKHSY